VKLVSFGGALFILRGERGVVDGNGPEELGDNVDLSAQSPCEIEDVINAEF
jgi:hypothetical protein